MPSTSSQGSPVRSQITNREAKTTGVKSGT